MPFTAVALRNTGCDARDPLRPGSIEETPLAIEFAVNGEVIHAVEVTAEAERLLEVARSWQPG